MLALVCVGRKLKEEEQNDLILQPLNSIFI